MLRVGWLQPLRLSAPGLCEARYSLYSRTRYKMSVTASETPQDAVTDDEISGPAETPDFLQKTKRNAFAILMSPKSKKSKTSDPKVMAGKSLTFFGRDGLGAYTNNPTGFPPSRVIYHNDDFVAINDLYPKSSVHALLLSRSPKNNLHPFDAFDDLEFLDKVRGEAKELRTLVAKELRRKYGGFSAKEQARERVLNGETNLPDGEDLPPGRDWEKDVMVGIHVHPSMNHLHVHVISVDRFSEWLKHRKHYNSFATPFFIQLEDFPLAKSDVRRHPGREGYLDRDFKCWRCGRVFGRSFSRLKEHLKEEFEKWKAE